MGGEVSSEAEPLLTRPADSGSASTLSGTALQLAMDDAVAAVASANSGDASLPEEEPDCAEPDCIVFSAHTDAINACAVFPNGKFVLTASEDGSALVWDAATGNIEFALSDHDGAIRTCAIFPDGLRIVTAGNDTIVRLWDSADGSLVSQLPGHTGVVFSCCVFPDAQHVLTLGSECMAIVWDVATGTAIRKFQGPEDPRDRREPFGHAPAGDRHRVVVGAGHHTCAIAANGKWLLIAAGDDGDFAVGISDFDTGEVVREIDGRCCFGCASFPDGRRMVAVAEEWTIHEAQVWDVVAEEPLCCFRGHSKHINACAVFPDGALVVTAGDDGTVRIWRPEGISAESTCDSEPNESELGPVEVCCFTVANHQLRTCAVFPDGRRVVAAGSDGNAQIWSIPS